MGLLDYEVALTVNDFHPVKQIPLFNKNFLMDISYNLAIVSICPPATTQRAATSWPE
jgi:hypothetical protein